MYMALKRKSLPRMKTFDIFTVPMKLVKTAHSKRLPLKIRFKKGKFNK